MTTTRKQLLQRQKDRFDRKFKSLGRSLDKETAREGML